MLIKNFLKLFLYANRNRNRLVYFSTKSFLQTQDTIFLSTKPEIKQVSHSYYLNYLMSRTDYYSSVFDIESLLTKSDSDPEAIRLLLDFESSQDFIAEEKFLKEVLNYTQNDFSNYGVNDICKIIVLISKYRFHPRCRIQMCNIKDCIDKELIKKQFPKSESLKILFTLSSIFNEKLRASTYYFHYKAILKLLNKIDSLSTEEIVQTFYCIPSRNFSKVENKFFVLSYLSGIIPIMFNSDELGIVLQGLVRGKILGFENISSRILDKIKNEIENIHPIPFISVCQALEKFLKISDAENFSDFQEKLVPHVSKFDKESLLSVVCSGQKFKILNPSLKEILIKKCKDCIMNFKYLDIIRLVHITVTFNIQDEELLLLAMENLEKIWHKNDNLINVLNNLSFHRLYSKKLLDEVFSDNFFNKVCNNSFGIKNKAEWWSLYCNVKLEKPEYSNNAFSSSSLNKIYKKSKYMQAMLPDLKNDKFYSSLCTIEKLLAEVYGVSKVFVVNVLPHFPEGIVMRFNKELQAQEIPEVFRTSDAEWFKKSLEDNHLWIFVLLLRKSNVLWGTDTLELICETQIRQLKTLGYKVITVKLQTFFWTLKQNNEKTYIMNLIDGFLKNISNEIK